jgi:chaperonin GroEL (HSP60 family)
MRAFADALDAVPLALAENSGWNPIETLAAIKSRQVKENNSRLGVDCMQTGSNGKSKMLQVINEIRMANQRPRTQT